MAPSDPSREIRSENAHPAHGTDAHLPPSLLKKVYMFLLISVAVHLVGLLIFGGYVILKKTLPAEVTFVQPPPMKRVEPKKRQYKLRVKQQKSRSSRPKLQQRLQSMRQSNVALPEIKAKVAPIKTKTSMKGMGNALGDLSFGSDFGGGVFSAFGYDVAGANRLSGNLFDFKQTADGKPVDGNYTGKGQAPKYIRSISRDLVRGKELKIDKLARDYYRSKKSLHATFWLLPYTKASAAPAAFNVAREVEPTLIMVPYSGTFVPAESGRFRFYGRADDILIVRLDGRIVLDASWERDFYSSWRPSGKDAGTEGKAYFGNDRPGIYGNWINLTAGKPHKLDVIVGEVPGGWFGFWLAIQKRGEAPKIFSTQPLKEEEIKQLRALHPDSRNFL